MMGGNSEPTRVGPPTWMPRKCPASTGGCSLFALLNQPMNMSESGAPTLSTTLPRASSAVLQRQRTDAVGVVAILAGSPEGAADFARLAAGMARVAEAEVVRPPTSVGW